MATDATRISPVVGRARVEGDAAVARRGASMIRRMCDFPVEEEKAQAA
jgi:hypothetical protein